MSPEQRTLYRVLQDHPQADGSTFCDVVYIVASSAHDAVALTGWTGLRIAVYPLGKVPRDRGVVR